MKTRPPLITRYAPWAVALALPLVAIPAFATPNVSALPTSTLDSGDNVTLARRDGKRRGGKGHGKMSPEQREKMRAAIAAKIDDYVRTTVATDMGLSDDKAQKLAELFKTAAAGRHEKKKEMHGAMQKLRDLLDQGAPEADIAAQIQAVRIARAKNKNDASLFDGASAFLTVEEQGRLILVLPQMRRDMRHMMRDAKGHGHKGRGHHGKGRRGGGNADERGGFGGPDESQ